MGARAMQIWGTGVASTATGPRVCVRTVRAIRTVPIAPLVTPHCIRAPHAVSLHSRRKSRPESMSEDRAALARQLLELRLEHRDLDDVIARLVGMPDAEELQIRRFKKRKLRIRDLMNRIEDALIPDQPA